MKIRRCAPLRKEGHMTNARNRIRLTFTTLIMLTAIAFSKVAVAEPQRPSRQFVPLNPFTLSGVCSFDVRIDPLAARGSSLDFEIAVSEYSRGDLSIPADLRADSGFQNLPEALNNSN